MIRRDGKPWVFWVFGFSGFLTARIEVFDLILLIDESYHHILLGFLVLLLIFYVIKITSWYFN